MKKISLYVTSFFALAVALLVTYAHEPHECPADFPDSPVISGHIEQKDIVDGVLAFEEIFQAGEALFIAAFNICDGQGRPATTGTGNARDSEGQPAFIRTSSPDSNACTGCHNQPRAGGGGDFVANVFVLAQAADPVVTSVSSEFSNNRNTLGMFGSGAVESLAREMTVQLQAIRDTALTEAAASGEPVTRVLVAKGVDFGSITAQADGTVDTGDVKGVDADLVIKPFHQAGVVISLREFTVNAMNHHHGMQADERFDLDPDKGPDFDQDGLEHELTIGDITAVTIWQASLGVPGRLVPGDPEALLAVEQGEVLFDETGCTTCHIPELPLESRFFSEPNPFNPPGTFGDVSHVYRFDMTTVGEGPFLESNGQGALVRAYTDLKRHNLCDPEDQPGAIRFFCNEKLAQSRPDQDGRPGAEFFLTRKLWDVGNSAPYGHRGDLTTITEAILMHGGEARESRDAFVTLATEDQAAIVRFLKTLQVLPPGSNRVVVEES